MAKFGGDPHSLQYRHWQERGSEPAVLTPPQDIYVEFYVQGMVRPNFGVSARLVCGPLRRTQTVFLSLGKYSAETGSVVSEWERVYTAQEVLRWRQTTELRGRMAQYELKWV